MGLDRDDEFARMRDLWIDASEDVLLDDQVGREYWMSDKWLECAGTKYQFGVTIRVLIDEGESDAEEYTFVSVSPPSANAKVIKATCHAFWTGTARDSYETYHFDMKPHTEMRTEDETGDGDVEFWEPGELEEIDNAIETHQQEKRNSETATSRPSATNPTADVTGGEKKSLYGFFGNASHKK